MNVPVSRLYAITVDEWSCMTTLSQALSFRLSSSQHDVISGILSGYAEIYLQLQKLIRGLGSESVESAGGHIPPHMIRSSLDESLRFVESTQKNIIAQIDAILSELVDGTSSELLTAIRQFHVDCIRWLGAALR